MLDIHIDSFAYPDTENKPVLQHVSFTLKQGEHLAVLGESGCGKSTLLHLIYGLINLSEGSIRYNNNKLLGPKHNLIPGEHFMKLVAQELDIMPFISVAENIASHLDRNDRAKDDARVDDLLAVVQLTPFKHVKVKNLSGGQKQRVAIAKALAQQPEVLLLDEPFSSIDTFLKNTLRRSFFNYTRSQNITCIIATHDTAEALGFTDRMLLLRAGKTERINTPKAIYESLENKYQASFFGEVSVVGTATYLPHQLKIAEEKTAIEMVVIKSYYLGAYYLIEGLTKGEKMYVHHDAALIKDTLTYISINDTH
jgi:ABC-type sulfate/molybdate transport systems ATPase subunit